MGTWKTPLVDLELKDDVTPVCSRPYTVPRIHEALFRKEVKTIVTLGVLKDANDSECGAHYFAQPEPKTNLMRFLSDSWNLKRQCEQLA